MKNSLPVIPFAQLTSKIISRMSVKQAEWELAGLIAERGRIRGHGQIVAFSEFNEDPDLLVNQMLAQILVAKIDPAILTGRKDDEIAVLSIENSAAYLASEVAHQLALIFRLPRPPRIIRARKTPDGTPPSPAMGEIQSFADVTPITSNNEKRHLIASVPDPAEIAPVRIIVIVDDFRATGDTIRGGIEIGIDLLAQSGVASDDVTAIPMAGLGKPAQEQERSYKCRDARIIGVLTAISVEFGPLPATGQAFIEVNGYDRMIMQKATTADFK
jgi:adenine/guanine phosphoribosyltransferase-like PRPP-binding protein